MCFHGAVLAFYLIAAITTFIIGIEGLVKMNKKPDPEDPEYEPVKMSFNLFTYTLPFVAFILDHSTKKILNLQEKSIYILVKLMIIIYYLGVYVLAL